MSSIEIEKLHQDIVIILAEDDPDDVMLTKEALAEVGITNKVIVVADGEELLTLLQGKTEHNLNHQRTLVLLDLNMPRKDGREALREIKTDPVLKALPVVVLTTSQQEEDISNSYRLGVNSYITKPVSFEELVETMECIGSYWFKTVKLPL